MLVPTAVCCIPNINSLLLSIISEPYWLLTMGIMPICVICVNHRHYESSRVQQTAFRLLVWQVQLEAEEEPGDEVPWEAVLSDLVSHARVRFGASCCARGTLFSRRRLLILASAKINVRIAYNYIHIHSIHAYTYMYK